MNYKNFLIKTSGASFSIYKNNKLVFNDIRTMTGSDLQSEKQAVNEAKKNIDTIIKLKLTYRF